MQFSQDVSRRLLELLERLYGDGAPDCFERIRQLAQRRRLPARSHQGELWSEHDVVLISYGDQIRRSGEHPLRSLNSFLIDHMLDEVVSTVHLLPFFPYSSDDGFSVIDYRQVDPNLGDWNDVAGLNHSFDLMFDLVLNHCSQHHQWFRDFREGGEPYDGYFIEADAATDLSSVTRPRSSPLLTTFETRRGRQHVWTTFSDDQVDLNFANPDVLVQMLDVLLFYAQRGARIVRLDAIAYLWKKIGTPCIHLPETHAAVKLFRELLDALAPGTILLTETNVPHAENISYFGDGDEAHMVYQFSLAPLLLDAFLTGDASYLMRWLSNLEATQADTTFFNFTASHDGIGVRPLEGLVPRQRIKQLIDAVRVRGGQVSTKRNPDGTDSPYELNITYFSALGEPDGSSAELHAKRFLASQAVMLALKGIPGIYFHSLVGTPNDAEAFSRTGRARTLNRRKFDRAELEVFLSDRNSPQSRVFEGYREILRARIGQPAFHPEASQRAVDVGNSAIISFARESQDRRQNILVLANTSGSSVAADLSSYEASPSATDLLSGTANPLTDDKLLLSPHQVVWLDLG